MRCIILGFVMMLMSATAFSQAEIVSCGGDMPGAGGSISYSVGQTFYNVYGSNITISEGVQQTYIISDYEYGIDGNMYADIELSAFPNPADDYLILSVGGDAIGENAELEYSVFDSEGRLVIQNKIGVGDNQINVQKLVSAAYYLSISLDGNKIKTFKVVKN